ncbi:hypothetical protein TGDOM2_266670 [Toxoplasma gondii GAB2-2007-GAL-DOM2]|uniref:Uncharacterized protein n=5 Tax=Toxoplasma gondii TaxID=5811 RepID=S7VPK5_TOXGG|nr:hypothetical protein TGGT1_266670 [Toxoplasma gondii GT1]KAF4644135.1 hypothetical protein TGRH88_011330 [Toxoplasma gondii]KFG38770.1 hypothetical protein TGDOM2_266670 [Toxoplasma gondii GAB2-2007-GAL-DOM2]KFG43149.1 hypothetical protein TGFOU_266670 [Toxoplasma gondii FOU]RQX74124.1 hypothetical protein TGCAST_266670 [Toxoplasma gondii CAST]
MKQIREDIQTGKNVRKRIKGGFTEDKHTCVATEKNAGDHADNKCELHTVETGPVKGKRGVCNQRVETKEPRHRGPDEDNVRNNANIGDDGCEDKYKTWETHSAPDNVDCKVAAGDSVVTEEEVTGDIKARAAPMVTDDTPRHKQTAQRQDTMDARAEEETEKGNEHTQPEHMYTINKQETDGGNTGAAHMTQIFKEMQQQWQNAGLQVEVGVDVLAMPGFSRVFESNDGNKDRGVSAADKPRKNHFLRTAPPVSEHNTASCSASSACKSRCVRQGEVDPNEEVKIEQEWEKQGRSRREYCLLETRESQSTREHEQCWQQDQSEDDYVSKSSTDGGNEKNKDADVREEFIDETGRRDFARPLDAFETFFDLATCSSRSSGHQGEIQKQGRCCGTVQRARERGRQLSNRFHTRFEKSLHPVRCRVHPWQAHPLSVAEKVLYMRKGMTPSRFLSTRWAWPRSSIPCPIFGSVPDPLLASSSACFRMPLSSADNRHSHVPGSLAMESPLVLAIRHIEVPSAQSASGHAEPSFALDDLEHRMGLLSYTVDAGTVAATSYCGWVADDPSRLSGFLTLQERGGPPTARTLASSSCTSVPLQLNNCCSLAINSSFLEKTLSPSLLGNHTVASSTMSKLFNSRHPLSPPPEYESTQEVLEVDPKGTRREVAETGNTSEKQQRQDRDKIQSSASNVLEHDKGRSPRLNIVTEKMTMRTLSDCTFSCLSLSPSASCCLSGSEPTHFQSDGKWKESASAVTELPRRQRRDSFVEKRKDMREQGVQTEISAECHGVKKTNVGYSDEGRGQSPLSTRARVLLKRWRRNSLRKQRHFLALLVGSGRTLASSSRNGTHTYAAQSAHIISTEVCNQALARVEAGIGKRGENKRNKGATKKEAQEQSAAGCQTTMSAPKAQASASIIIRLASQSMPTDAENTSFTLQGGSVGMGLGGRERGNRGLCSNPQMRGTAGRKDVSPAGFPSQHVPKNVESDREEDFEQGWATIGFGEAFWESSSRAMDPGPASQVGNAKTSGGSVPLPHFSALSIKCSPPASQRPCSAYASILSSLVVRADVEEDNNIYTKEDHESEIPTKNNDENKTNDATSKPGTGRARGRPRKGQAQANYTGNSGCRTQPEFGGSTGVFRPIPATKTDMTVEAEGQLENTKKKCTAERRRTKRSARAREIEAARGLAGDEKRATKEEHGETRSLKARVRKVERKLLGFSSVSPSFVSRARRQHYPYSALSCSSLFSESSSRTAFPPRLEYRFGSERKHAREPRLHNRSRERELVRPTQAEQVDGHGDPFQGSAKWGTKGNRCLSAPQREERHSDKLNRSTGNCVALKSDAEAFSLKAPSSSGSDFRAAVSRSVWGAPSIVYGEGRPADEGQEDRHLHSGVHEVHLGNSLMERITLNMMDDSTGKVPCDQPVFMNKHNVQDVIQETSVLPKNEHIPMKEEPDFLSAENAPCNHGNSWHQNTVVPSNRERCLFLTSPPLCLPTFLPFSPILQGSGGFVGNDASIRMSQNQEKEWYEATAKQEMNVEDDLRLFRAFLKTPLQHPKELLVLPKNLVRPLAFLGFLDENQTERPKEEGTPMMMNATPSASPSNRLPYNIPPGEEDVSYSRSTSSGERTAASSSDSLTGLLELWLEEGDKIARENAPPKQPTVSPGSSSIRSPATTYGSHTRNRQEPRELFCPAKQEEQNWLKTWHQKEGMQHWEGEKLFTDPGFAVQGKNAEAEGRDQEEAEKSRGDATVGSEACGPAVVAVAVVNVGSIVSVTHKNQRGHEVMERHMPQEEEAQMVESVFSPSYCSTPSRGPSVSMAHATEMETANDMSIRARQPSIFPQPREDDVYSPPPGAEEPTTSFAPSSSPTRQREWQGKFSNRTSRRCALDGGETDTRIPPRSSRFPSSANAIHAAADRELQLKQSLSKVAEEATKLAAQFERMDRLCFALEGLETDREERRFRMSSLEKAALRPQVRKVQCSAQFQSRQKSFSSEEMSSEDEISWQWKVERRRGRFFRTKGKVFFSCFHPAQWREYILNKMDVGRDSHWDLNADNWSSPKSFSQPNFRQRAKDFLYCHLCL